ncbi:hypothetical protein HF072_06375 [Bacillus sp. RO3]|nr:hypothetical protein [Bacillus sp. RO3]
MKDIKWTIMINSIVLLLIGISLFFYEPYFYTRIVFLVLAASDILLNVYRKKVNKGMFFLYASVMVAGVFMAGIYDHVDVTVVLCASVIIILMGTYKSLFEAKELPE